MKKLLLLLVFILPTIAYLQSDEYWEDEEVVDDSVEQGKLDGFVGMMGGAYIPNNNIAYIYNGGGENGIQSFLNGQQNTFNQSIQQAVGYDFSLSRELPVMRYKIPVYFGLNTGFKIGRIGAVILELNYMQLKLENYYDIIKIDPGQGGFNNDENTAQTVLQGKERRMELNLGFQKYFWWTETANFYLEALANFNVVSSESFWIFVNENYTVQLFGPTNNYNRSKTGFGYGGMLGAGFHKQFNEKIIMELGGRFIYNRINVTDSYTNFLSQGAVFVKVLWDVSAGAK